MAQTQKKTGIRYVLGKNIAARRQKEGLTQAELANILGVAPISVSRWERGDKTPGVTQIESIARALDCSTALLFRT